MEADTTDKSIEEEAQMLRRALNQARVEDEHLTQKVLILEMGLEKSQANVSRWFSGVRRVPDKWLFWLADRLKFDALELRPSLSKHTEYATSNPGRILSSLIAEHGMAQVLQWVAEEEDKLRANRADRQNG